MAGGTSNLDGDLSTIDGPASDSVLAAPEPEKTPALTIVGHPSWSRVGEAIALPALESGGRVSISRLEPLFGDGDTAPAPLGDQRVSRRPVNLLRLGNGSIRIDRNDSSTSVRVDGADVTTMCDLPAAAIDRGIVLTMAERVVLLLHRGAPMAEGDSLGLVGSSASLATVRREIRRIADSAVTVLVRGETGVGKELVARAIHIASKRRDDPFVAVNMAAIPPSLAAAELFGAERGSFTGSIRSQEGHFVAAGQGTLFLDEIGEAPLDIQAMILRVLDGAEVWAVGSAKPKPLRARVVAATDAHLEERIAQGAFRAPLLHRLAGYVVAVPALRHRRDDIARLLRRFLMLEQESHGASPAPSEGHLPRLSARAVETLVLHDWPGNVRQLRNVARQIAAVAGETEVTDEAVARVLTPYAPAAPPDEARADALRRPPDNRRKPGEVTEDEVVEAMRACRWDLKAAAERLHISRTSLYALVEASSKLRRVSDLTAEELERSYKECGGDIDRMVDVLQVSKYALRRRMSELRLG